jgi:molecular chaperone GrpE
MSSGEKRVDAEAGEYDGQMAEEAGSPEENQSESEDKGNEMQSLVKKKDEEIAQLKDQLLRSRADFDNFRKRCVKTDELNKKLAVKTFALDVIQIHDDLIRASEAAMTIPEGASLEDAHKSYVSGVMMISKNIESALGKHGVTEVESMNAPFNPNVHEAVAFDTSDDVSEDTVTKVFLKGFSIDQMVIRPAKVMVSKPGKKADSEGSSDDSEDTNE